MNRLAMATLLLMMIAGSAQAGQRRSTPHTHLCRVDVLFSEKLPIGPLFYHTIKATLLITPPDRQPFEMTLYKVFPWQVPPPRRGQSMKLRCDAALASKPFRPTDLSRGPTELGGGIRSIVP